MKRGISNDQICILTLVDDNNRLYLEPVSVGRLEKTMAKEKLKPRFTPDKSNVLVTDDHNAYNRALYGTHATDLEKRIIELFDDDDVTSYSGIYSYLITGEEKHLSIRAFDKRMVRYAYEIQKGICKKCNMHFDIDEMQADHITPWSKGGKTIKENCQMLCADCNRKKSNI